jgi:hypothetical protein
LDNEQTYEFSQLDDELLKRHNLKREELKDFIAKKGDTLVAKVKMSRSAHIHPRPILENRVANMLAEVGFAADYTETGSQKTKK